MPIRAWPDRTWHCRILLIGAGQQIDPPAQRHQMLAQHRLQLAGMTEGELPQQRCDRRGRVHAVEERHHRAAAQGVDVIDAVRVRAHARDNGDQLRCVPAPHRSGVMSAHLPRAGGMERRRSAGLPGRLPVVRQELIPPPISIMPRPPTKHDVAARHGDRPPFTSSRWWSPQRSAVRAPVAERRRREPNPPGSTPGDTLRRRKPRTPTTIDCGCRRAAW